MAYSNTDLTGLTIDRVWDNKLLMARYAKSGIMPKVLNKSDKVKKSGEIISIQIKPKLTVGTVGAGGTFATQKPVPTQINILVNTWVQIAVDIDDQAKAQSFWDPTNEFATDAGAALAVKYDTDLAALYSSLTGLPAVGDANAPEAFDHQAARTAMLYLADSNVPLEDLNFFLPPVGWYGGVLAQAQLTDAMMTGGDKSRLLTNAMTNILGVPLTLSTVLATVSGTGGAVRKGLLLHKEAFGIGMQLEHEYNLVDLKPAKTFAKMACTESLYGLQVVRSDHGVVLNIKAS